jgi:hypothetical protein
MRKLTLKVDELRVESFDTADVSAARGTVLGNEQYSYFCPTAPECRTAGYASCVVTRCHWCSTSDDSSTCP